MNIKKGSQLYLKILLAVFVTSFLFLSRSTIAEKGIVPAVASIRDLIPCGQQIDNPNTLKINEAGSCGIPGIFVAFRNVLSFLLWKIGILAMVLILFGVGLINSINSGSAPLTINSRSFLKFSFKTYIRLFLAWLALSLILFAFGY